MSEYTTLIGAEDVSRAGHNIAGAADTISRASANMENALHQHELFLDDWLERFEEALDRNGEEKKL